MTRISKTESKSIRCRFPGALIVCSKHHDYLGGYDSSPQHQYLERMRGIIPQKKRIGKKRG